MAKTNIRTKIKEVAKEGFINATDEFCDHTEQEIERMITPEFLEEVRSELLKKSKTTPTPPK